MARTKDLSKLRNEFVTVLDNGERAWIEAAGAERRKTVAEDIFLRMVVAWEEFVSDWFIGAVNHDASRFKLKTEQRLARRLEETVRASPYERFSDAFRAPVLALGTTPSVATVRALLDPTEGNIEFRSYDDLLRRSGDCLVRRFVERVGRVGALGGGEIIDCGHAVRNVLAHRSARAVNAMNERVAAFPTYPHLRKKSMSKDGIGTYLSARTSGGAARLAVFKTEYERIARALVP